MIYHRVIAILLILAGIGFGYFNHYSEENPDSLLYRPIKLGLDLQGGTLLVYEADTDVVTEGNVNDAVESLREVIERRINTFGVSEPKVYTEKSFIGEGEAKYRLVVELPGVTNLEDALSIISRTPVLEFKTENPNTEDREKYLEEYQLALLALESGEVASVEELYDKYPSLAEDSLYVDTELTGRLLNRARVEFSQQAVSEPIVAVSFNSEGAELFAEMTRDNIGKTIGIYLDGVLVSAPVVQSEIRGGQAQITGAFSIDEANKLARDLNLGALPVPIELVSSQTIGATLGGEAFSKGVYAGLIGLAVVALFMLLWYRLPGLIAVISLYLYIEIMITLFKVIPVTLTAAGIAGLVLSIGMAVDANILIFERMKDELRKDKKISEAITDGFSRAWLSIRDSNLSSLISSVILFWFGTSLIKGFALTLSIGILVSMFTAVMVTRTLLLALGVKHKKPLTVFLFGSGLKK